MKNMYVCLFVYVSLLGGHVLLASTQHQLQKAFYHKGCPKKGGVDISCIELDSVIFYFSHRPTVNTLSDTTKNGYRQLELFFPAIHLQTDEAKKMVSHINGMKDDSYTVRIKQDSKPMQGVKVLISYDCQKVGMTHDSFDFIGGARPQPGFRIKFHDQELLKRLTSKCDKAVLHTACAKKRYDIALDFGHGGHDNGTDSRAIGYANLKEKDVAFAVGTELYDQLKKEGFNVIMTRKDDTFVALDARTSLANSIHADLFLSIHANASPNKNDSGIETYYLDPSLLKLSFNSMDAACTKLANAQADKRCAQSKLLAQLTQEHILREVRKETPSTIDRKVHGTVLQVLAGITMPGALMEIGFLSNPEEALLLSDAEHRIRVAQGICKGVVSYFSKVQLV